MNHLTDWPRGLPQEQKKTYCPECGALTVNKINQETGACRLECGKDANHWASQYGEHTWEGRLVSSQSTKP